MKAMAEIAAAKENPLAWRAGVELWKVALSLHGFQCVNRMLVSRLIKDRFGANGIGAIHGDKVVPFLRDALKGVHPIVGCRLALARSITLDAVVPRRPGAASLRHHAFIGMQCGDIFLIAECWQ